jgi:hypothetical protein
MRSATSSLTDGIGSWLDRLGRLMQPAATKKNGRPASAMGHLVFQDDELPFSMSPQRRRSAKR